MTLIDVLAALSEGSLPSTAQLTAFLDRLQTSSVLNTTRDPKHADQLDAARNKKTLLKDVRAVISALEVLVKERNGNDEAQELFWRMRGEALKLGEEVTKEELEKRKKEQQEVREEKRAARVEQKERRKQLGKEVKPTVVKGRTAYGHLLTLARITLVQPELRHILADFALLGLEIVDQTGSDTFGVDARHGLGQAVKEGGGTVESVIQGVKQGHSLLGDKAAQVAQDPVAAAQAALPASTSAQLPNLIKLKQRTLATVELIKRQQRGEDVGGVDLPSLDEVRALLKDELQNGLATDADVQAALDGTATMNEATSSSDTAISAPAGPGPAPPLSRTDLADLLQIVGVDSLLATAPTSLSAAKLRATDAASKARVEGVKNARSAWQEQGQDRLIARLRRLLVDVQGQDSSREAALWFLGQVELVVKWMAAITIDVPNSVAGRAEDAWDALGPGLKLLERFEGGKRVRPILTLLQRLSRDVRKDPDLSSFVTDVHTYLGDCLIKQGWVLERECETVGRSLITRFQALGESYRTDFASLLAELKGLVAEVPQDPAVTALERALKDFGKDLTLGRKYFYFPKPHVWQEIIREILPPLFKKIDVLPIPRIRYTNPECILTLENIAISLRDLIPNTLDVRVLNDFHVDFKRIRSNSTHCHSIKIKIKGMGLRIHKVAFAIELLKGVHFTDKGILDLLIRDVGISIYLDIPKEYSQHFFTVRKVKGKLGKLQISVHKSNHFILHYLAEALVDSSLTKLILRNLMAKGVTLGLQQLDVALMQLRLNPAEPDDRKRMVRLKQQASELRDLMVKLRERAGTLEIDFLDVDEEGKPIEGGRSRLKQWQEETHVLRWVKGQVQRTGTREVVRDRWRSNVFDLDDGQPVDVPASAPNVRKAEQRRDEVIAAGGGEAPAAAAPTSGEKPSAEETQQEAVAHSKPQGPTTQATVEDAAVTLEKQKVSHWSWFSRRSRRVKGKEGKTEAKSKVGKEAEKEGLSLKEQTDVLEKRVESRGREEAAAAAQ